MNRCFDSVGSEIQHPSAFILYDGPQRNRQLHRSFGHLLCVIEEKPDVFMSGQVSEYVWVFLLDGFRLLHKKLCPDVLFPGHQQDPTLT